jgi:hypothetical protein
MAAITSRLPLLKNPHTAITDPLPGILYNRGFTTISNALHPTHFSGTLGKWDFELDCLKFYHGIEGQNLWKRTESHCVDVGDGQDIIHCGMEISLSGRFTEHCLKSVSLVGQDLTRQCPGLRLDARFGDSRIGYVYPEECAKEITSKFSIMLGQGFL